MGEELGIRSPSGRIFAPDRQSHDARAHLRKASVLLVLGLTLCLALALADSPKSAASGSFLETFDGAPAVPTPWHPANWDVTVHSRDVDTFTTLESMHAGHGTDCSAPPATHDISSYDDAVFLCRDHVMTAINASGYGVIYLTPNQLVDFSASEAVVRFDVSTLVTSGRDWIDFWITPFQENVQLVGDIGPVDLNGLPKDAVHVRMNMFNDIAVFRGSVVRNFDEQQVGGNDALALERLVAPSAAVRTTFELHVSRTHLKFGIPSLNAWWVDDTFADLGWSSGVLQIGHHSYNPAKGDGCGPPIDVTTCTPNTWHWDNIGISPAVPFTMLQADRRNADEVSPQLTFSAPAPAGAHLRFAGIGNNLAISFDGGTTWQAAELQAFGQLGGDEHFRSYWTPVPAGIQNVRFRGTNWFAGPWLVRSATIWASGAPITTPPQPLNTPVPTVAPAPTASTKPGPNPTPSPVAALPPPPPGPPSALALAAGVHSTWVDQSAYPVLSPGAVSIVTLHFRNVGTVPWRLGVADQQVNLGIKGDSTEFADAGLAVGWLGPNRPATTTETTVTPGGIGTFTFAVRAPEVVGSYRLDLGLVLEGVTWLEDQGVYVVVTSDVGLHSRWVAQTDWPILHTGEASSAITLSFRNTGSQTWSRGISLHEVDLGVADDDRSWADLGISWPSGDRPAIQAESSVPPGGVGTFTFRVRAPQPGTYVLRLRLVVDGVTWLDDEGVFVLITVLP